MAKDPRFDPRLVRKKTDESKKEDRTDDKILGKEIANNTILTDHLSNNIITTDKIVNSSISTVKIADSAITTAKLADGQITDAKMTTGVQQRLANSFIKKQIVHRRILHGAAYSLSGDMYFSPFSGSNYVYGDQYAGTSRFMYGPYGYGAPGVQSGAERRTRIYAIWSDNITNQIGFFEVRVTIILSGGAGTYAYSLGSTWGDTTTTRDGYSNEIIGLPSGAHGTVYFHVQGYADNINAPASGRFHYVELQHLDVFP